MSFFKTPYDYPPCLALPVVVAGTQGALKMVYWDNAKVTKKFNSFLRLPKFSMSASLSKNSKSLGWLPSKWNLLGAGVLGHGLGSLRDGVLGQLSGKEETDGGLDLARGDGGPLVVVSQTASLGGDALKDVVDK